jgi:ribonuclease HI
MTAKNKPIENKDLIMDIRQKIDERDHLKSGTYFVWVKGHANNEGNTAADKLAVEGASMGRGIDREVDAAEDLEMSAAAETFGVDDRDSKVDDVFSAMERAIESAMNG